jgi:hypothetical protein
MKLKDFFTKLKEQGDIKNEEYIKFLETAPDSDIPDTILPAIEEKFMTADRAVTHKEVDKKMRHNILNRIDEDINELKKILPADVVIDLDKADSTYKKMEIIKKAIPDTLQKAAKAPDDAEVKKKIDDQKAIIQDLTGKIEKINGEYAEREKKIKDEHESAFKNYRLDSELEKLANSFTFADAYKDSRPALTKALLGEIKAKHALDLTTKDGQTVIEVLELGDDGKPRGPKFNGNTPVTIQSLLEEPFKPFLKQNNADTGGGQTQTTQQFRVEAQTKTRSGARTEVSM